MLLGSIYYLGITLILFGVFVFIVWSTCRRKNRERNEEPKYRMMDDHPGDDPPKPGK